MNQNDINRIFTEKVTELIAQGFQINPATMSGSQGEYGKVDLRKGSEIIRVLLDSTSEFEHALDCLHLVVGRVTDQIRPNTFDKLGNTIWNNHLEIISEIKFAKIADNFFTDVESGIQMREKNYQRWKARRMSERRDLSDAFKSIALRYVQKQPRMKTCKLSDIERVTRVNWSSWERTTPNLYGYEIVAKGRTFLIKAPRQNH